MVIGTISYPELLVLFDLDTPDHPVLWAVLYGRHGGKAFVECLGFMCIANVQMRVCCDEFWEYYPSKWRI